MGEKVAILTVGGKTIGVKVPKPFWHEVFDTYPRNTSEDDEYSHYYVINGVNPEASDLSAMRLSIALRVSNSIRNELQTQKEKEKEKEKREFEKGVITEPSSGINIIGNVGDLKKVLERVWGKTTITGEHNVYNTQERFHHSYLKDISSYSLERRPLVGEWQGCEGSEDTRRDNGIERYITSRTEGKKGIIIITKQEPSEKGYLAALWDGSKLVGNYNMKEWLNKNGLTCHIYFWELPENKGDRGKVRGEYPQNITIKNNDRKTFSYAYFNEEQKDNNTVLNGFIVRMEVASASERAFARREFSMTVKKDLNASKGEITLKEFPLSEFLSSIDLSINVVNESGVKSIWIARAAKVSSGLAVVSIMEDISNDKYEHAALDAGLAIIGLAAGAVTVGPAVGVAIVLLCALTDSLLKSILDERYNAKDRAYKPGETYTAGRIRLPPAPPIENMRDRLR